MSVPGILNLSHHQMVLRGQPRELIPSEDHTFVRSLLGKKLGGTEPTLGELHELHRRLPGLDDVHWGDVGATMKAAGVPVKGMGRAPEATVAAFIGGELGTAAGVQRALMDASTDIFRARGTDNSSQKARYQELQTLRSLFLRGAQAKEKVASPGEKALEGLVEKRKAGETLTLDEGLEAGRTLRRPDVTAVARRHAHAALLEADGKTLGKLHSAKQEDTLELLYPREQVVKGLAALEPGTAGTTLEAAQALAKHQALLELHDTGHYTAGQDLRYYVAAGPNGNFFVAGGSAMVGIDRTAKNLETNTFQYRPFVQLQGNVTALMGGYVFHPTEAGFIRGVAAGVNLVRDPLGGELLELPVIPSVLNVGASDTGTLEFNAAIPLPLMHLPLPMSSKTVPLAFPFFGLRVRAGVQEPRLEPIARGLKSAKEKVGKLLQSGGHHDPLPKEFRPHPADLPQRMDWLSAGLPYLR